jgi:hypothetical protein
MTERHPGVMGALLSVNADFGSPIVDAAPDVAFFGIGVDGDFRALVADAVDVAVVFLVVVVVAVVVAVAVVIVVVVFLVAVAAG